MATMENSDAVLTVIDGVILLVVVMSALVSAARGFTREVMGFFSFVVAGAAAYYMARPAARLFSVFDFRPLAVKTGMSAEMIAIYAGGAAVFLVAWVSWSILGIYAARTVHSLPAVGPLDRALGFVYGGGRGLLFCVGVFASYTLFVGREGYSEPLRNARLLWVLEVGVDMFAKHMPPQAQRVLMGLGRASSSGEPSKNSDLSIIDKLDAERSAVKPTLTRPPISDADSVPRIEDILHSR